MGSIDLNRDRTIWSWIVVTNAEILPFSAIEH